MHADRIKILTESLKRLLRRNAISHLKKIVNKTHAADISIAFRSLSVAQQHKLFDLIKSTEQKGVIFSELDEETFMNFIEGMNLDEIVVILDQMPTDDVADLLGRLPEEKANAILERMKKEGSDEIVGLLRYDDDTAGGIMVPDFIALREDITAREAVKSLQEEHSHVEMPFYLYVVDECHKLVGVCSLRQLVVVAPATPLKDFMSRDIYFVRTGTDQEEVAKIVARYDILAVPVLNDMNILVGIVTVDDVIDIMREEATEDILKMAGAGEEFVETKSVIKSTRIRLPWLFASCVGGILAVLVIGHFEEGLKKFAYLAAFIPVIMGMGGNIGTQSSTIVVRGLATGHITLRDIWSIVFKELAVGLILGITYGLLIGLVAQIRYGLVTVALSVGLALVCSMTLAALIGSVVPMLLARIHIDPAVATGPFVTTSIDILGVFFYFQIATLILGL